MKIITEIVNSNCNAFLKQQNKYKFDCTFLDPPFNQGKDYKGHDDNMEPEHYWQWMEDVCKNVLEVSNNGAAIYFMQREKNTKYVLDCLEKTGWTFQNLIIWRKKSSPVPQSARYGKQYQIIVFATKGERPRVFNRLRIDPTLLVTEKYVRENGVYLTDVWDDIRELTSGYFAGDEPLRLKNGERAHKQQCPVQLLLRILLSSTNPGDWILDPFAGTGTTSIVAHQLQRNSVGIELNPENYYLINERIKENRKEDSIIRFRNNYIYTENLNRIWHYEDTELQHKKVNKGKSMTFDF